MVAKKSTPPKKTAAPKKGAAVQKKTASPKKAAPRKKPAPAKKKTVTGGKHQKQPQGRLGDKIVTIMTTSFFVVFALFVAYVLLHPQNAQKIPEPASIPVKKVVPLKIAKFEKPDFEIFPTQPIPSRRAAATPRVAQKTPLDTRILPKDKRPVVAIIIDDLGYDMNLAKRFMALDTKLTCAVLPHSVYFRQIAELARKGGHEVMLHQPMEPNEFPMIDPGPGALLSSMSPDDRIKQLNANIDLIPGVCGVNNHMGSKTTTMSDEMNQVFTVLKKRGLFFIDSRTTAATLSQSSARLFKVPFAERDVFLDHVRKKSEIRAQIEHLINIAEVHGKALGIGHPYEITYEVLKEALPEMEKRVRIIPASEIVEVF
jgi:polysaccharide deacetylase 2 family uncharacterized protein YibQ